MSKKTDHNGQQNQNKTNTTRRKLILQGGAAAGGLAAFAAGYGETAYKAVKGLATGSAGVKTAHGTRGQSLTPEFSIDPVTGLLSTQPGQTVTPSSCLGCWTQCGVRVRVDTATNRIIRVAGNPYHPLATTNPAPMEMHVRDVYAALGGEQGLEGRATSCARGSSMLEQQYSPYRVLTPLKRVGKRGEGKWMSITFEQLIEEVCEGGNLFGEGQVDGLRAIFDNKTLIDPENPEYGPISNQLLVTDASNEGRTPLINRFARQSFGTVNVSNHGAYCGQSFRVGAAAALGNIPGMPHGKPDWSNAQFGLFIGTAPAQSGNPFQRQGRELAQARTRSSNIFKYIVVSPILPTSSSFAAGSGNRWVAVKPAGDLALAMGLIRWIIENEHFDARCLSQPGPAAMRAAGEASWTNATHLIVAEPNHPRFGTFLRGADFGWPKVGDEKAPDVFVVKMVSDGKLMPHDTPDSAALFIDEQMEIPSLGNAPVRVCSALAMLREQSQLKTLDEYAELSGVPRAEIESIAREFSSYGKSAVADAHGGTMNGAGFYTAYAIAMLNTLVGNLNVEGGLVLDAGPFGPFGPGPKYNFANFPGKVDPKGVALSRNRFPYEKTSEYRRKKETGQSPYPAPAPWYPLVGGLSSEMLASGLAGYPYHAKVWINHMSNPVYSIAGFKSALVDQLRDPTRLPLIVSVDPFINETSAMADYIVPDTITYESWGIGAPWADVIAKTSTVRCPAVEPRVAKAASGVPVNLETFLLAVAKRLKMPGFGEGVITNKAGEKFNLETAEDFYLRGIANIAFAGVKPVEPASDDDLEITGMQRYVSTLQAKLKPDEWREVAMVMTRGGRFDKLENAWDGKHLRSKHVPALQVWSEDVSKTRHSMTGERNCGCPTWYPNRLAGGQAVRDVFRSQDYPFLLTSYKSNLMSSISIGVDRLRQVHPHNPVSVNRADAKRLGIQNGDTIRITTPGGSLTGIAMIRDGVIDGCIAIEHGYGHTDLGARKHIVDGKPLPHNPALAAGINLNDLGLNDKTHGDVSNAWIDWMSGAVVRQGLPARIEKA